MELVGSLLEEARTEYSELFSAYGTEATKITLDLEKRVLGAKPPAGFRGRVGHTIVGKRTVYYTDRDYPELFEIKRTLLETPDRLRSSILDAARSLGVADASDRKSGERK